MTMRGACTCRNFELKWHTVDFSITPRACQCDYCRARDAAWVSKPGTAVDVTIHSEAQHRVVIHGSGNARFHECGACGEPVLVTAVIDGETYGVLNARCLDNRLGFAPDKKTDFSGQDAGQKRDRWRQNWCCPVHLPSQVRLPEL